MRLLLMPFFTPLHLTYHKVTHTWALAVYFAPRRHIYWESKHSTMMLNFINMWQA